MINTDENILTVDKTMLNNSIGVDNSCSSEDNISKNGSSFINKNYNTKDFMNSKYKMDKKEYSINNKSKNYCGEFTAKDAKLSVEKDNIFADNEKDKHLKVKVGYPKYKNDMGEWLVPAFDKKTGKFVGSVYVYGKKSQYCLYVHGPDSYKAYKIVSSGKKLNNDQTQDIPVKNCG